MAAGGDCFCRVDTPHSAVLGGGGGGKDTQQSKAGGREREREGYAHSPTRLPAIDFNCTSLSQTLFFSLHMAADYIIIYEQQWAVDRISHAFCIFRLYKLHTRNTTAAFSFSSLIATSLCFNDKGQIRYFVVTIRVLC